MKRFLGGLLVCLILAGLCTAGFAAGKLNVEQENFWVVGSYAYCYARVRNVGDKPIKVQAAILEVFDAEGENITSTDYQESFARYLQPDEYTYVSMYVRLEPEQIAMVDDYMLTVVGKSDRDYISVRYPVVTRFEPKTKDGSSVYDYMFGTMTNDTDSVVFAPYMVLALLDAEDNILYITNNSLSSYYGLEPGSVLTYRPYVSSDFRRMFEEKELVPVKVDAIAYKNVEN